MMTHTIHRDCILIQARLPTLWGREIVNVSGLSLRLSPTWAARRSLLKGKTGWKTLLSCLTHSVTVDPWTRLRRYFTTLCILEFLFSAWLSPFNTSLLDVDWFSFDNVLRLRSSKWLRLPIAYPNFSGVELKWKKKKDVLDSDGSEQLSSLVTEMKSWALEKRHYKYQKSCFIEALFENTTQLITHRGTDPRFHAFTLEHLNFWTWLSFHFCGFVLEWHHFLISVLIWRWWWWSL